MSKSILVIDTPENCCQRRFSGSDGDYFIIPNFGVSCVEDVDDRICEKMILLHAFEVEKETVKLLKEDDKK